MQDSLYLRLDENDLPLPGQANSDVIAAHVALLEHRVARDLGLSSEDTRSVLDRLCGQLADADKRSGADRQP